MYPQQQQMTAVQQNYPPGIEENLAKTSASLLSGMGYAMIGSRSMSLVCFLIHKVIGVQCV